MAVVSEQVWFDRVLRDGRSGVYSLFGFVRDIDRCVHTYTKRCHVTNCSDVPQQVSNTVHTPYIDQSKLMPTPETHINPPNLYSCRVLSPSRNLSICSKKRHGAGGRRRGRRRSLGPGAGGRAAPGEAVGRRGSRRLYRPGGGFQVGFASSNNQF